MNALISMVLMNNSHVKKLNAFHRLCRSDPREAASVSDDKEVPPVPTLGTFMEIQVALGCPSLNNLCPDMPPSPQPCDKGPYPNTPDDPTIMAPNTVPISGARDLCDLITRSSPMAAAPEQPPKHAQVDDQKLGPINSSDEVSKNKKVLNMIDIPNSILQMAYNKLYIPL